MFYILFVFNCYYVRKKIVVLFYCFIKKVFGMVECLLRMIMFFVSIRIKFFMLMNDVGMVCFVEFVF